LSVNHDTISRMNFKQLPLEHYRSDTFAAEMQQDLDLTDQQTQYVASLETYYWAGVGQALFAPHEGVAYLPPQYIPHMCDSVGMRDFFVRPSTQGIRQLMDFRDGDLGHRVTELQQDTSTDAVQRVERVSKRLADLSSLINLNFLHARKTPTFPPSPGVQFIETSPDSSVVTVASSSAMTPGVTESRVATLQGGLQNIVTLNSAVADANIAANRVICPGTTIQSVHQGVGAHFTAGLSKFALLLSQQGFENSKGTSNFFGMVPPHARMRPAAFPDVQHLTGNSHAELLAQATNQQPVDTVLISKTLGMTKEQFSEVTRTAGERLPEGGRFAVRTLLGEGSEVNDHFVYDEGQKVFGRPVVNALAGLIEQNAYRTMPVSLLSQLIIFQR